MKALFLILFSVTCFSQVLIDHYRFASATGNNLLDGLQAGWRFEETSGNPQDSSGNARHLTHFGIVESTNGIVGNSRYHDSTENDDYFSVASDAWNQFGTNDFTIAYWCRPGSAEFIVDDQVHVAKADTANPFNWSIGIDNGAYDFDNAAVFIRSTNESVLTAAVTLAVEFQEVLPGNVAWFCVIVTRESGVFTMRVGKESAGTFFGSATVTEEVDFQDATIPLSVGSYFSTYPALETNQDTEGEIDELYIWNRALSECEIYKFFNAGVGRAFTTFDSNPCL